MLQRFLFIALTLCSLTATAQWQQTGSKVRYVNGLGIPTKDTAAGVAADSSQIVIRPADSALYIKYKRTWLRVGGGGGSIAGSGTTNYVPKFNSSFSLGNSIIQEFSSARITINAADNGVDVLRVGGSLLVNDRISAGGTNPSLLTGDAGSYPRWQFIVGAKTWEHGYRSGTTNYEIRENGNTRMVIADGGNAGIGYTAPAAKLAVSGTTLINTNIDNGVDKLQVSGSVTASGTLTAATIVKSGGTSSQFLMADGSTSLGSGGSLSGTTNYVPKFTSSTTIGNSSIFDNGNVSLRTTVTTYPVNMTLGANAGIAFHQDGTTSTILATNQNFTSTADLQFQATKYTFSSIGRVIIATSSDNGVDELQVNGSISGIGFKQAYVTKTGAYTATNDDYVIDCTSGTFTVTLPASSGRTGRILIIKNSGAGTITVDGNASETIDGAATYAISVQYGTIQIMSDGTNWKIIAKF